MVEVEELLKRLKHNFREKEKAAEREEWSRVEKIAAENNEIVKKLEGKQLRREEKLLLKELFEKGKEIEKRIEEKIELLKKKIAVTQNISKNLNNLFTQTEEPSLFIDEKK